MTLLQKTGSFFNDPFGAAEQTEIHNAGLTIRGFFVILRGMSKKKSGKQKVRAYYSGVRLHLPPGKTHSDKRRKNRSAERAELKRQLREDEG